MIWWLLACLVCLMIGAAIGVVILGAFTSGKIEDARRPTLIGHRPGVKTSRVDDALVWTPYCLCGWEGPAYDYENVARHWAEEHAKGLV